MNQLVVTKNAINTRSISNQEIQGSINVPSPTPQIPTNDLEVSSYREAMKATVLTGMSSILVVVFAMIRSKTIAVFIGPEGIGLFGILNSSITLVTTFSGLGINKSGVRQIAAASASNDSLRISRVIYTLRRTSLISGLIGATLVALFSNFIARITAGSAEYAQYLLILAPMVMISIVNGGQLALLRGLRQILNIARLNIFGAFVGTLTSVPLVILLGIDGIAPALLTTACVSLIASWWFVKRIRVEKVSLSWDEIGFELFGLLSLGGAFLLTGLMSSVLHVSIRAVLLHASDLYTVGQFVAAAALSHVYADFVLQAMSLDYLPRLTKANSDNLICNRLINEQTEISLLVGAPGVIGFIVLAPSLLPILYSDRFTEAAKVFQWQSLGVIMQLVGWTIGTLFLAKGLRKHYIATMVFLNVVYFTAFYLLTEAFGLLGAACSYAIAHAFYLILTYFLVRHITGFNWTRSNVRIILITSFVCSACLGSQAWIDAPWNIIAGVVISGVYALWAYHELCKRLKLSIVSSILKRIRVLANSVA